MKYSSQVKDYPGEVKATCDEKGKVYFKKHWYVKKKNKIWKEIH